MVQERNIDFLATKKIKHHIFKNVNFVIFFFKFDEFCSFFIIFHGFCLRNPFCVVGYLPSQSPYVIDFPIPKEHLVEGTKLKI